MPIVDTLANTTFGSALTAAGSTSALTFGGDGRGQSASVLIVATAVTTGASFTIEVEGGGTSNTTFGGAAANYAPIASFAITANGSYAVPIDVRRRGAIGADTKIRVTCTTRTDGSYACSLSKLTKG